MTIDTPTAERLSIAVVEDDEAVRNSLAFLLQTRGCDVHGYGSALEALASSEIAYADGLIIDFTLPDFHGVELINRLRDKGLEAPAVIIASVPTPFGRAQAARAEVPLLEKPLTDTWLERWLAQTVQPARLARSF
jgi:two-component system, LuxR family, response regulator FixJ